jgi:hypothetical protein
MLCGMTLGRVFEPGQPQRYADPAGFLCALYYLNLINQGVHSYFRADHPRWTTLCEPFPDLRGCSVHHGGVSSPGEIIRFAKSPFYVTGAEPISVSEGLLRAYAVVFFRVYVPAICARERFELLSANALTRKLQSDPDCPEFSRYAEPVLQ